MDQIPGGMKNMEEFFMRISKNVTFQDDKPCNYTFNCGVCNKSYLVNEIIRFRCDQCYPQFTLCEHCFLNDSRKHDSSHTFMGTNDTRYNASRASPVMFGAGGMTPPIIPYIPILMVRLKRGIEYFNRGEFSQTLQMYEGVSRICDSFPDKHQYQDISASISCYIGEIKRMRGDYSGGLKDLKLGLKLCLENEKKRNSLFFSEEMERTRPRILLNVSKLLFNIGNMKICLKKLDQCSKICRKINSPLYLVSKLLEFQIRILQREKDESLKILGSLKDFETEDRVQLARVKWMLVWGDKEEANEILVKKLDGDKLTETPLWKAEVLRYSKDERDVQSSVDIFSRLRMVFSENYSRVFLGRKMSENGKIEEGRCQLEKSLKFFKLVKNKVLEELVGEEMKKL